MPPGNPLDFKITRYFDEILHAPVTNPAWSWGSESKLTRVLYFRVWADQIDRDSVQVSWPWVAGSNGGLERARHLDLMRSGRPTIGVICTAVKTDTGGKKRTIKQFDRQEFLRLGLPLEEDDDGILWATIEERLSFAQLMDVSGTEASAQEDIKRIREDETLDETTKQRLVDARLGQGKFRAKLFARWDGKCAVTGSVTSEALRASHIVPWSLSDNSGRIDANNGILLNAGIDALFDRRVVTFSDSGELIISKAMPASERAILGIEGRRLRKALSARSKVYLARHRELFDEEEKDRTVA